MAEVSTPTTRLEAVNSIISSVGEAPANSLDAPSRQAVILGVRAIDEASRIVQSKGWYWNTEEEVLLTADGSGFFNLASNILRARVSNRSLTYKTRRWVYRNGKLYDSENRTYVFTVGSTVYVDQVVIHPFEELPEPARYAIWARGGVLFQARHLGGETLFNFTEGMARAGFGQLLEDEVHTMRWNLDEGGALRDLVYRR